MPFTNRKATRQQIKNHNKRLILRTIYEHGEISRTDIARPTVSNIVSELMSESPVVGSKQCH